MITSAFGSCCCAPTGAPSGSCAKFAASVFDAACPASVVVAGDFTFECFTAGGHSRGCLGMPATEPIWGKLKRGTINVSTTLYRTQCGGSTPYITTYRIQSSCVPGCTPEQYNPLLCNYNCPSPTGCRTYTTRENPCSQPEDVTDCDEVGTRITRSMLNALPVVSSREIPCNEAYYACTHFLGSDGYRDNIPVVHTETGMAGFSTNPLTALGQPRNSGLIPEEDGCPSCWYTDKPPFGVPWMGGLVCTGTARCSSTGFTCVQCSWDIEDTPIVPHLRAAVTGLTCYTIKDENNNCFDSWIHFPPPVIFSGPWIAGDPYVPAGIPNLKPGGVSTSYPRLVSPSEGLVAPYWCPGGFTHIYPFTYGKKIISTPECIPNGNYVMFGNMGSGLNPTVLNRCAGACTGLNDSAASLVYSSISDDFTLPFGGCNGYYLRTIPFTGCWDLFQSTGLGEFAAQPLVSCPVSQCCCRQAVTFLYDEVFDGDSSWCVENDPVFQGSADPPICKSYPYKQVPVYTNLSQVTNYYANNHPRHDCRRGVGGSWSVREKNITTATCSYYTCCGQGLCANSEPELENIIPCGGLAWETPLFACTGANYYCPNKTCMYNPMPHGFTTKVYVHLLRPFPSTLSLTWNQ